MANPSLTPFSLVSPRSFTLVIDERDFEHDDPQAGVLEGLAEADGVEVFSTQGGCGEPLSFELNPRSPNLLDVQAGRRHEVAPEAHQWEDWAPEFVEPGGR